MFVRNRTKLAVVLSRGALTDERSVGNISISTAYAIDRAGLTLLDTLPDPVPGDPPDIAGRVIVRGCSVTAAGTIWGPSRPPYFRTLTFTIGAEIRRLVVFGERRWTSAGGDLVPSEPLPFESIPLSFEHAFGGSYTLPPGLLPGTDLPFPGGKVPYPLNGRGIGFYPDKAAATGARLPFIELMEQFVTQWSDRPIPGGFSPCPELGALRLADLTLDSPPRPGEMPSQEAMRAISFEAMVRMAHHAPGYLVFNTVPTGTRIELQGVGKEPIRFELPAPPARVSTRRRQDQTVLSPVARSIHLDADRRLLLCVHGYEFAYEEPAAPSWIVIEPET